MGEVQPVTVAPKPQTARLGADHLISGGGGVGVEDNVPEQSIYFFPRRNVFILPAVKNKLFFVVGTKVEIFF